MSAATAMDDTALAVGLARLSVTERAVFDLLGEGLSAHAVARRRGRSPQTIYATVNAIRGKLRLDSLHDVSVTAVRVHTLATANRKGVAR